MIYTYKIEKIKKNAEHWGIVTYGTFSYITNWSSNRSNISGENVIKIYEKYNV